jgi:hypothetical protein
VSLAGRWPNRQASGVNEPLAAGLYESLLTTRLEQILAELPPELVSSRSALANAESEDRVSRHIARLVARTIRAFPETERAQRAVQLAVDVLGHLETLTDRDLGLVAEAPLQPGGVLHSVLRRLPDGTAEIMERPLTPLLDTTVLTNAPGEPVLVHETRAEIPSSDSIDVLMAFIRWSGVRNADGAAASSLPGRKTFANTDDDVHE